MITGPVQNFQINVSKNDWQYLLAVVISVASGEFFFMKEFTHGIIKKDKDERYHAGFSGMITGFRPFRSSGNPADVEITSNTMSMYPSA